MEKGSPWALLVGLQIGTATIKNNVEVLQKIKLELPYDLAISLMGIYPNKSKMQIQKDICTPMFIATLFTIAKI